MDDSKSLHKNSKFTPETRAAIIASIAKRVPYEIAANANGISWDTLYRWLREGRADMNAGSDSEKSNFYKAIKKVEEQRISEHLDNINNNIERWQAQAWILERRWNKHFGANAQVQEINQRLDEMELEMGLKKELKDAVKKVA